ncbi:hypothetical protein BCR42DRAFT_26113 [Absidia repens]|uniref:Uncharacterized protein n=1 Tax=Absidia repens TaxID=90262 RepID=A0A1X2IIG6_9FUNG|nr:hypothetical protein BCR42DRAFT_26113 [Absidia repens]
MLITPLHVFASVRSANKRLDDPSHRIVVVKTEEESTPHLLIQDLGATKKSFIRLRCTDSQFSAQDRFPYTEQLEKLVYDFTQGYNSAGVSINAG